VPFGVASRISPAVVSNSRSRFGDPGGAGSSGMALAIHESMRSNLSGRLGAWATAWLPEPE
jgi:hypothetical protein